MFHNRQQLIHWLTSNAPDRVISNALENGTVENYGGFDPIPDSPNPGWILRLVTRHNQEILLVVSMGKMLPPAYYVWRIKEIPWESWQGRAEGSGVLDGDKPEEYVVLRERARIDYA